jgi:hypothetical protein
MAEGGGIEPLTLPRCHPSFRGWLPDRSSGAFRSSFGGRCRDRTCVALLRCRRLSKPLHYRSANLPATIARMIGIDLGVGASGVDSNPRPAAYKAAALPTELRRRCRSGSCSHGARMIPRERVGAPPGIRTRSLLLLRQARLPFRQRGVGGAGRIRTYTD